MAFLLVQQDFQHQYLLFDQFEYSELAQDLCDNKFAKFGYDHKMIQSCNKSLLDLHFLSNQ